MHHIDTACEPGAFSAVLATLPMLDRNALAALAQAAIDRLDMIDGDADLEPGGDELDGDNGEDDAGTFGRPIDLLAGCPFADPAEEVDQDSNGNWLMDQRARAYAGVSARLA